MMRLLAADPGLDPANDTSVDPVPDLLAALALYPKRAEPLMQLSRHSEWMRDKCDLTLCYCANLLCANIFCSAFAKTLPGSEVAEETLTNTESIK